jgi:hypothetical protein
MARQKQVTLWDISLEFDQAAATGERTKSSPDFSMVCIITDSLRATAMAARLNPIFL